LEIMQVMFQLAEFALVEVGRIVFVTLDCVVLDVAAQQPVEPEVSKPDLCQEKTCPRTRGPRIEHPPPPHTHTHKGAGVARASALTRAAEGRAGMPHYVAKHSFASPTKRIPIPKTNQIINRHGRSEHDTCAAR